MLITHELMNNKSYLVKRYVEICIFKQKKLKKFLNKKFSVPFTHGIAQKPLNNIPEHICYLSSQFVCCFFPSVYLKLQNGQEMNGKKYRLAFSEFAETYIY